LIKIWKEEYGKIEYEKDLAWFEMKEGKGSILEKGKTS
jgi:hypothetical protein